MNEDKATRYQRLRRRVNLASAAWTGILLAALLLSGGSVALRSITASIAGRVFPASAAAAGIALFVTALLLIREAVASPIALGRLALDRRYGRTTDRPSVWMADHVRARVVAWVGSVIVVTVLYAAIAWTPSFWWLVCGIGFALGRLAAARYAPLWLFRMLHRVRPLESATLRPRLVGLARRVGANELAVYAWRDAEHRGNAVLAGVGSTRTMYIEQRVLDEYSADEIEVIAAHELAHHVHGDVWKGLAVEALVTTAGLWLAAVALASWSSALGFAGSTDVAGLPLVLLSVSVVSIAARPLVHAVSRAAERRADRLALELTGNAHAFVTVVRRLASEHLAEDMPSRIVAWLWHRHPPIHERIAAARAFEVEARRSSGARRAG